jgi:hypothetical protein
MNYPHESKEAELRRREESLKKREVDIRMRELEAELSNPAVLPTSQQPKTGLNHKLWYRRLNRVGQFFLLVIGVIVAVRVAAWLATLLLLLSVSWVAYKLFLEPDHA